MRSSHGLACPNCGNDDGLYVTANVQIELAPRRYIQTGVPRVHESNDIQCVRCGNFGTVAAWRVWEGEDIDLFCIG